MRRQLRLQAQVSGVAADDGRRGSTAAPPRLFRGPPLPRRGIIPPFFSTFGTPGPESLRHVVEAGAHDGVRHYGVSAVPAPDVERLDPRGVRRPARTVVAAARVRQRLSDRLPALPFVGRDEQVILAEHDDASVGQFGWIRRADNPGGEVAVGGLGEVLAVVRTDLYAALAAEKVDGAVTRDEGLRDDAFGADGRPRGAVARVEDAASRAASEQVRRAEHLGGRAEAGAR